jgi:hypothetical protein
MDMKSWLTILLIAAFSFAGCNKNYTPGDSMPVQDIINTKQYVFLAETANPMGGTTIRLSYGYDLIVKPGEVIATLPYYGRAYVADRNFSGMRFTSVNFSYDATAGNQGWEILIRPADVPGVQELRLSVTTAGYATLYITSTSRQPISYYGRIQEP